MDSDFNDRLQDFMRALRDGEPKPIKEFEDLLRDAGAPKAMAVAITSHGYAKAIRGRTGNAVVELREAITAFNEKGEDNAD